MSLNYLSKLLLETAGLKMTAYDRFLEDVRKKLPSVSASGYYDREGRLHQYEDGQSGQAALEGLDGGGQSPGGIASSQSNHAGDREALDILRDYEIVQYHYLFSGEERMEEYFRIE